MKDFAEILNGIYGRRKNPVLVFGQAGELLWHNGISEVSDQTADDIFAEIAVSAEDSGKFSSGFGGNYSRAEICGAECIIAELFGRDAILEFMSMPQVVRYAQRSEMLARHAVTGISASGEMMCSLAQEDCVQEAELCRENLYKCCCRLMRGVSIYSQLVAATEEYEISNEMLYLDMFLEGFAKGCERALIGSGVIFRGGSGCIVSADKTLLTYFLLSLVRQLVSGMETMGNIEISVCRQDDSAEICISTEKCSKDSAFPLDEVADVLSRRLEAEYAFFGDCVKITLKCAENMGTAVFETDRAVLSDSIFSPYNIMLGDIDTI